MVLEVKQSNITTHDSQAPLETGDLMSGNIDSHEQNFEQLECWKACRSLRLFVVKKVVPLLSLEECFLNNAQRED